MTFEAIAIGRRANTSFRYVAIDLIEKAQKPRRFQQVARTFAGAAQAKRFVQPLCRPQNFQQHCEPRGVQIGNFVEIHRQAFAIHCFKGLQEERT